ARAPGAGGGERGAVEGPAAPARGRARLVAGPGDDAARRPAEGPVGLGSRRPRQPRDVAGERAAAPDAGEPRRRGAGGACPRGRPRPSPDAGPAPGGGPPRPRPPAPPAGARGPRWQWAWGRGSPGHRDMWRASGAPPGPPLTQPKRAPASEPDPATMPRADLPKSQWAWGDVVPDNPGMCRRASPRRRAAAPRR